MSNFSEAFEQLRQSEMNAWVGGSDPETVGEACSDILLRHVPAPDGAKLLDFGCGIGRVMLSVLRKRPGLGHVMGVDIVPKMVRFCDAEIAARFPNTSFELLADANDHYERFKEAAEPRTRAQMTAAHSGRFDAAYAFSVFTHVDARDFSPLLRFIATLLKPGGRLMFTAFILTPYSRANIADKKTLVTFPAARFEAGKSIFIGNRADRLAFIAYDLGRIEQMVADAGLVTCAIEYGDWRGGGLGAGFQDVIVCRMPLV